MTNRIIIIWLIVLTVVVVVGYSFVLPSKLEELSVMQGSLQEQLRQFEQRLAIQDEVILAGVEALQQKHEAFVCDTRSGFIAERKDESNPTLMRLEYQELCDDPDIL